MGTLDVGGTQVLDSYGVPEGLLVTIRWSSDRRIRNLQLRGESSLGLDDWIRTAVGALELGVPSEGWHEGVEWKQKGTPQVMLLATAEGMGGSFRLVHAVDAAEAGRVTITSRGEALLVPTWSQNSVRGSETISVTASGTTVLDPRDGLILERTFQMVPAAGGGRSVGAVGQTVRVRRELDTD